MMPSAGGGYLLYGSTDDDMQDTSDKKLLFATVDANFDLTDWKTFGSGWGYLPGSFASTRDGGFVTVGSIQANADSNTNDIYVTKMAPEFLQSW